MNRKMNGFELRRERKKASIIKVALELFSVHGVKKVTIADIAKKANVSQVTIYNYFGSKEELLKSAILDFLESALKDYQSTLDSNIPFPEKIEKFIFYKDKTLDTFKPDFLITLFAENSEIQALVLNWYSENATPLLEKLIQQGREEGYINPDISTEAIWFYINLFRDTVNRLELYSEYDKKTLSDITRLFYWGFLEKPSE